MNRRLLLAALLCIPALIFAGAAGAADKPEYVKALFPVERDGKWGYIDAGGAVVIPLQYEAAQYFNEGLAAVKTGGKWGFVDEKGAAVIPPAYEEAREFSDGLAWAAGGDWAGFIDKSGRQILRIRWGEVSAFREGYAVLSPPYAPLRGSEREERRTQQGKPRPIDKSGNALTILRPGVEPPAEGKPPGAQDVLEPDAIESFHEGLARVQSGLLYGYADTKGRTVIAPQYEQAWSFCEGCAAVALGGKHFFIRRDGRAVADVTYDDAQGFQEGLAAVKVVGPFDVAHGRPEQGRTGGKWGFVNQRGEVVIAPQFDAASSFFCGMAAVKVGDKWGDIDPQGKMAIEPRFAEAHFFLGDLAAVRLPGDPPGAPARYINKAGVEVWPPKPGAH